MMSRCASKERLAVDKLSVLGLLVALGAIAIGYSLEGGVVSALFNGPALIIVLGGTLGAVMLQTSANTFKKMLSITHWVFVTNDHDIEDAMGTMMTMMAR